MESLIQTCGFAVTAFEGSEPRFVNLFDTSNIQGKGPEFDPDLGSPNRRCRPHGPGMGAGGLPGAAFPNCEAQGNTLIIQDPSVKDRPNDNGSGGCFVFQFFQPIELVNMVMLDVEEPNVIIKAIDKFGGIIKTFTSPLNVGRNGKWAVNSTQPFTGTIGVHMMEVCLPGSGYFTRIHRMLGNVDCFFCVYCGTYYWPSQWADDICNSDPFRYSHHNANFLHTSLWIYCGTYCGPTTGPTTGPATQTTCNIIQCDFSTLAVGVPLTELTQAAALELDCLMNVSVINTIEDNVGTIFDSADIKSPKTRDDPDLGSPSGDCPNSNGPGRGNGGKPNAPFPNCVPLGNLLIIQNENLDPSIPNDSAYGGCFVFEFVQPVTLLNFGIMDVDENATATISITSSTGPFPPFESPSNIGDNGHWTAATTNDLSTFVNVVAMEICLPGLGAISFIDVDPCNN